MKRLARLALAAATVLTACETTGDPRRGGLFGWSETKAQQRQMQKRSEVAAAEAELARESNRGDALSRRSTATDRQITAVETRHRLAEDRVHARQTALLAKTDHFDEDCPTAATASRARAVARGFKIKIETVVKSSLPPEKRMVLLRQLEADIDAAKVQFAK